MFRKVLPAILLWSSIGIGAACPEGKKEHVIRVSGKVVVKRCVPDPAAKPKSCALVYQHDRYGGAVWVIGDGVSLEMFLER